MSKRTDGDLKPFTIADHIKSLKDMAETGKRLEESIQKVQKSLDKELKAIVAIESKR